MVAREERVHFNKQTLRVGKKWYLCLIVNMFISLLTLMPNFAIFLSITPRLTVRLSDCQVVSYQWWKHIQQSDREQVSHWSDSQTVRIIYWQNVSIISGQTVGMFHWQTVRMIHWQTVRLSECFTYRLSQCFTVWLWDCQTTSLHRQLTVRKLDSTISDWMTVWLSDIAQYNTNSSIPVIAQL